MNKNDAMKLMIDGKKIVDTSHRMIHYYSFEDGGFKFTNDKGQKSTAHMPDINCFEIFMVKKTKTVDGFTTKANMALLRKKERVQLTFSIEKTKQCYLPIRVSWEEVEE